MDGLIEGRIVHYVLGDNDANEINLRRTAGQITRSRTHVGNHVMAGEHFPAIIVRVFPEEFGSETPGVNLQVFLDGNDTLWVTSAKFAEPGELEFRTWHWIEKS